MTEITLPDKVIAIHRALDAAGIAHVIGGAIALAYYAEPRATNDVDVNVSVPVEAWRDVAAALEPCGVDCETNVALLERDGWVRWMWGVNPVDVFFSYDAIHDAITRDARMQPFGQSFIPMMAPEHLMVCKAVFDRPKDWSDIAAMLAATSGIDIAEVRRWLDQIIGPDDRRRTRFDEIAEAVLGR